MSNWQSPWTPNGSLLSHAGFPGNETVLWRDADYTWWEALKIERVERGRSAAHLIWRGVDRNMLSERYYPMFLVDTLDLLQHENIAHGYVRAQWKVVKRGSNYGIARANA